jgi:hypothetical protein
LLAEEQGETRRTRPLVCLWIQPRMIKEAVVDCSRMVGRVRVIKQMPGLPYLNLLVVTVRAAWFNFRAWKKRP